MSLLERGIFKRAGRQVQRDNIAELMEKTVMPLALKLKDYSPATQEERDLQHSILVTASRWTHAKRFHLSVEQEGYLKKKCIEAKALVRKMNKAAKK